ncbi:MAG: ArsR family transcriptional regulator [Planctomycetota bacterium]|nr:MAG: ArsR family transcriptional regulator [Planctomycetota bacterium]
MTTKRTCGDNDHQAGAQLLPDDSVCLRAAGIFRALGDPGRLQVLALLSRKEMCVTEIALSLEERISTVSQRLKLLKSERLVQRRREGQHLYYSLTDKHVSRLVSNAIDHAQEVDA